VEPSEEFDKLRLNKGAENYEDIFERPLEKITKHDPSFNDPKLLMQSRVRVGFENLAGRSFDPLIQGDPGELLDIKQESIERVKNDSVDFKEKGLDATKPVHHDHKTTVLFNSNPRTS